MPSSPLLTVAGEAQGPDTLKLCDVVDRAVVHPDGRVLISLIDVLAAARLDVAADLMIVEFVDGTSRAMRLASVIRDNDVHLSLTAVRRLASYQVAWTARLWFEGDGPSPEVFAITATTFASFVGST